MGLVDHDVDALGIWVWLENDWTTWIVMWHFVPDEWVLTVATFINTFFTLLLLFQPEGEGEKDHMCQRGKYPLNHKGKCYYR